MTRRAAHFILPVVLIALLWPQVSSAQHRRGGTASGATASPEPLKGVIISFHGTLKDLSKKTILLACDDNKLMTLRRSSKTKYLSGDREIKAGDVYVDDNVTIDATEDNDLKFLAVAVRLDATQPARKDPTLVTR